MKLNKFKKIEIYGKWFLLLILKRIIFRKRKFTLDKRELKKILIFRLVLNKRKNQRKKRKRLKYIHQQSHHFISQLVRG